MDKNDPRRNELENYSNGEDFSAIERMGIQAEPAREDWRWVLGLRVGHLNCHGYSFGLGESASCLEILRKLSIRDPWFYPCQNFVRFLIERQYIVPIIDPIPQENNIVLYIGENDNITHSGLVLDPVKMLIKSKWGSSPVFIHHLWQVPRSYGLDGTYMSINFEKVEECYLQYVGPLLKELEKKTTETKRLEHDKC